MKQVVESIIKESIRLKDKYAKNIPMELDYVCIFCQTEEELKRFTEEAKKVARFVKNTSTGRLYLFDKKYPDNNGVRVLKIRIPDETRRENGDCDFKIKNYQKYREQLLSLPIARLIVRQDCEMIELWDNGFNSRVYFSNPPVREQLDIEY